MTITEETFWEEGYFLGEEDGVGTERSRIIKIIETTNDLGIQARASLINRIKGENT